MSALFGVHIQAIRQLIRETLNLYSGVMVNLRDRFENSLQCRCLYPTHRQAMHFDFRKAAFAFPVFSMWNWTYVGDFRPEAENCIANYLTTNNPPNIEHVLKPYIQQLITDGNINLLILHVKVGISNITPLVKLYSLKEYLSLLIVL